MQGFTLIEFVIVIAIIVILVSTIIPSYIGYIEYTKKEVCNSRCVQFERIYKTYLITESTNHSNTIFDQYLQEYGQDICPEDGEITCLNGDFKCSLHSKSKEAENDNEDDVVPFL